MEIRLLTGLKRDGQRHTAGAILDLPEGEVLELIRHGAAEHVIEVEAAPADTTSLEREQLLAGYKKANAELTADNSALRRELERARARKHTGPDAAELRELKAKAAKLEEELEAADRTFTQLRTQNGDLTAKCDKQAQELEEADEAFAQLRTQNGELRSENERLTAEVETLRNQILTMQHKAIGEQEKPAQTAQTEQAANSGKGGKSDAK